MELYILYFRIYFNIDNVYFRVYSKSVRGGLHGKD